MTRQEAVEILWQYDVNFEPHPAEDVMHAIDMAIEALEQEPKRGKWIHGKEVSRDYIGDACVRILYEDWHCSSCRIVVKEPYKPNWNYCPHCGAKMGGEEE